MAALANNLCTQSCIYHDNLEIPEILPGDTSHTAMSLIL